MGESDLHIQLKHAGTVWARRQGYYSIATEVRAGSDTMWVVFDVLAYMMKQPPIITAIEAKATRSDFRNWKKAKNRDLYLADYNYLIAPRGLLKAKEVPEPWGLISVGLIGVCIKQPDYLEINKEQVAVYRDAIAKTLTWQVWCDRGTLLPRQKRRVYHRLMGANRLMVEPKKEEPQSPLFEKMPTRNE